MKFWKLLITLIGIAFTYVLVIVITANTHPIFAKWLTGSARVIGKPIGSSIYIDGQLNSNVGLFHVDEYWSGHDADYYILSFLQPESDVYFRDVLIIDRKEKMIGLPVGSSRDDYNIFGGYLFQSETGSHYFDLTNGAKGYDFEPNLLITEKQILFQLPKSETFKWDSIRIELY